MFLRKCKTCKKEFTIDQGQADWLKKKGLELFTHCECCRKERRAANEQQKKGDHS